MVAMRVTLRLAGSFLALAILAAPVAGMCAALALPEDPCEMRESHQVASCGHAEMVMTGCCEPESVDAGAEGILPGPAGEMEPPGLAASGVDVPDGDGDAAVAFASDRDPPSAVPRYRLFSALLL